MAKVGIIGMGWVGSSVAISLLLKGVCEELLINDIRDVIAEGEAMDLSHGSSFYAGSTVRASQVEEMIGCDAIVITAGRGGKPGESRLDLLNDNIEIVRSISLKLLGFKGLLIIVANPVDVLTYYYWKFSGLPSHRVIGTGTMLDNSRLREAIGRKLNLDPRSIHANVIGEHGDSEVVIWSRATVGMTPIREWYAWNESFEPEIEEKVKKAAQEIIKRKGATNHAIGLVTATLIKWILRGKRRIITLSTVLEKDDVAISLPCVIGKDGIEKVLEVPLSPSENKRFKNSVEVLQKAVRSVR